MWNDSFNLSNSSFKIWIRFEKLVNFTQKADNAYDGWSESQFYESFAWAWAWTGRVLGASSASVY